jgi:membrane-bound serine protease (ClpP class)
MEWVVTLLVAGAVLMLLETILPGLIAGVLGLLCLIGGVIQAYVVFGAEIGNYVLAGVIVGLMIGTFLWVKYLPTSRAGRIFASKSIGGNVNAERPELLHQSGTTLTTLRPCGTALIGGRRIDVVTEGSFIEPQTPVKVVAIEGLRVVVRALSETSAPTKS